MTSESPQWPPGNRRPDGTVRQAAHCGLAEHTRQGPPVAAAGGGRARGGRGRSVGSELIVRKGYTYHRGVYSESETLVNAHCQATSRSR